MTQHPRPRRRLRAIVATALLVPVVAACTVNSADEPPAGGSSSSGALTPVKLQLQWLTQGQFAGYYAAVAKGYYREQGLDVTILEGGVDIVPQQVLAQGQADFAIAWVPKALATREQGTEITDVAQVYQRSGTYQVSFKDKNITTSADLEGMKVGNWGFGNEFELFAGMTKSGLNPGSDVSLVQQAFDMNALISGDIDAAQAMSYNEYAQVLEAENPDTGKLFTAEDLNVIDWNKEGTAMLQDAVWASTAKLSDATYQDTTVKFLAASLQGWAYCRDNVDDCATLVTAAGSKLGASHQKWMINEVNKLIWPSPNGIGTIDEAAWNQTVEIAKSAKNADGKTVLTKDPVGEAYTNDYVTQALDILTKAGVDTKGESYSPVTVTLNKGGQ